MSNVNVHFPATPQAWDDLKITHRRCRIVQMPAPPRAGDDYYPFGLAFNSYQRPSETPQKFLYNGVENVRDLGLNLNMTLFRPYDPALGRFTGVDPLADIFSGISPYSFAYDNPILFGDPDGLGPIKNFFTRLFNPRKRFIVKSVNGKKVLVHIGRKPRKSKSGRNRGSESTPPPGSKTQQEPLLAVSPQKATGFGDLGKLSISQPDFNPAKVDIPEVPNNIIARPPIEKAPQASLKPGDIVQATGSNLFHGGTSRFRNRAYVRRNLVNIYTSMQANDRMIIIIHGVSNLKPSSKNARINGTNFDQVVKNRATAVRDLLIEMGIDPSRIEIGGTIYSIEPGYNIEIWKR